MKGARAVPKEKSLGFLHPHLVEQWDDEQDIFALSPQSGYIAQWRCPTDPSHKWSARVQNRTTAGSGCPLCPREKKTFEPLDNLLRSEMVVPDKTLSKRSSLPVLWRCSLNHEWLASPWSRAVQGTGCPYCSNRRVLPGFNDLATTHPSIASQLDDPGVASSALVAGSNREVTWRCEQGHTWRAKVVQRTRVTAAREKGSGCPTCAGRVALAGFNDLATISPDLAAQWADDERQPTEVTRGSAYRALWQCDKGHQWTAAVTDRVGKGNGCPSCDATRFVSTAENEILAYVTSIFDGKVQQSVRSIPGIRELDIYLPSRHFAIEYNGIYFHSEAKGRGREYHAEKVAACKAAGIRLIQVWEDDWRERREIVKRMLAHKLGLSQQARIPTRATTPASITKSQAKKFLDENHIQGWTSGTHYLALLHHEQPVAVMVLKKTDKTGLVLRLERFATSASVPGGQSKLIRHAERTIAGWEALVTFADLEVSDGNLYEQSGWVKDGELPPDYRYAIQGRREHKFNYRLRRFSRDPALMYEEGKTEKELAALNGLWRVWDSGKIRYKYDRRQSQK